MSDIAQALAKAKERVGHTTAPFLAGKAVPSMPAVSPEREAAIRKARRTQRFWLTLICVALPLTAFVLWSNLSRAPSVTVPMALSDGASPGASVQATTETARPAASGPTPVPTAASSVTTATASPSLRPDIAATVASLVVSATLSGENPRVVIAGKSYRVGDTVQGEIRFVGIADGQLRFADSRGAVYVRRF